MIIHLFVSDIQLPLSSNIIALSTKAQAVYFVCPPPKKAEMGGIIDTNLWNSLWRREASIWVWIWLILDTLRECYHHKAKAIYLIDSSVNTHTHIRTHAHTKHTHASQIQRAECTNPREPNRKNVKLLSLTGPSNKIQSGHVDQRLASHHCRKTYEQRSRYFYSVCVIYDTTLKVIRFLSSSVSHTHWLRRWPH